MGTNTIDLKLLSNARIIASDLRMMRIQLMSVVNELKMMNAAGAKGVAMHTNSARAATAHKSAMGGLALRFVGYNMILGQVMGAQQKMIDYVKESITKYREFETRIAEVSTIMTGDFEPALMALKAGVETLALSFGKNTSDMTKGLYDIMSAAFSADEAIALLATSTKAAIAGLADVRESVDIFTTVLNTYGMSAYEATQVSDTLFQSVVRGKFQFKDLESALGYVVPIAAQAGIAFDELMAALSTATRHGLHLDMASRGLAMAIQNIISPSEGAAKAARKYGLDMSGLALRVKGLTGFFKDLQDKTKEYGKIVLTEVIPNIRSLRVAMVLAGEEGLQGMIDDMDMLSIAGGRTEEALNKIMNTSAFVSSQITQQWEKTQRDVGKNWDEFALGGQKAITDFAANWQEIVPVIGPLVAGTSAVKDAYREQMGKHVEEKYYTPQGDVFDTKRMAKYLELQKEIAAIAARVNLKFRLGEDFEELNNYLNILVSKSNDLQDGFNEAFGDPILGGVRNLEVMQVTLDEITLDIERLKIALEKPITYGWSITDPETGAVGQGKVSGELYYKREVLLAEQEMADARFDVKMGLIDETYAFKGLNEEQRTAIGIMREHARVLKEDREATILMNVETRKLRIQMLEIQLAGMSRRRGLTRSEQKKLKQLQIEQLKLTIANMKATKNATAVDEQAYLDAKAMIDKYLAEKENELYQLKYTYDQQLLDLDELIESEERLLADRAQSWKDMYDEIEDDSAELLEILKEIFSEPGLAELFDAIGIDIEELLNGVQDLVDGLEDIEYMGPSAISIPPSYTPPPEPPYIPPVTTTPPYVSIPPEVGLPPGLPPIFYGRGFETGTQYVHETGPAMLHRGEKVTRAGEVGSESNGGDTIIENVTINIKEIADIADVKKLGALMSYATSVRTLNKRGKTNYRTR